MTNRLIDKSRGIFTNLHSFLNFHFLHLFYLLIHASYEAQVKSIESRRADEVNKMQLLLDHVDAVKEHVKQLAQEVEIEKINSTEAADELSVWEERVKSCKETQNVLSQEKVSIIHIDNFSVIDLIFCELLSRLPMIIL